MTVYADSKDSFRTLVRIASKSIADPPWFAVPVNAQEDEDAVSVHFHVPGKMQGHLHVQASEHSVTVWGSSGGDPQRPIRLCPLPCQVVANQVETAHEGDLLRVRLPKKRPALDSREVSPAT
jgi:HSP20 family molecular chaperone IbpA